MRKISNICKKYEMKTKQKRRYNLRKKLDTQKISYLLSKF